MVIVKGDSGNSYTISWNDLENRYVCTCPDFAFRQSRKADGQCKHILRALDEKKLTYNRPTQLDARYAPREFFVQMVDSLPLLFDEISYKHAIVGSWRRGRRWIKDIDAVVWLKSNTLEELKERIKLIGTISSGKDNRLICKFMKDREYQVDIRIINNPIYWGSMLCHCTGSKRENIRLRFKAIQLGLRLNEYGIYNQSGEWKGGKTEEDIYDILQEPFKAPEERE
jgi:DNA polymerase/3'-5' exonuclease PolX